MNRGRLNVAASVPATGASKVSANSIVVRDADVHPDDVEEAIKQSARQAIRRFREVSGHAHRTHVHRLPDGQLTISDPLLGT